MQTECIPGNIYIHYRNQKKYIVTSICKHGSFDSNLPYIAVYHQLDEEDWVYYRNVADFNEVVTWNQDGNIWRYKYLNNINNPDPNDEDTSNNTCRVSVKEGSLNIQDEYITQFIEDNRDMIVPIHIETKRKRRTE